MDENLRLRIDSSSLLYKASKLLTDRILLRQSEGGRRAAESYASYILNVYISTLDPYDAFFSAWIASTTTNIINDELLWKCSRTNWN